VFCLPVQAARTGVSQALADDARVIGDCDLRVGDIRVPELFPFEAVKPLVMNRTESLNLALDRNIPSPGQHIQTRLLIFMRAVASFIRLRPLPTQEFKNVHACSFPPGFSGRSARLRGCNRRWHEQEIVFPNNSAHCFSTLLNAEPKVR
jgi:hypothetical protein